MLSDKDSNAYAAVVNDYPYGKDIVIEKEDCINHVSKRMGKALKDCSLFTEKTQNMFTVLQEKVPGVSGKGLWQSLYLLVGIKIMKPTEIGRKLVPIFNRLSEVGLLKRFARGSTQNAN
eukprot:gene11843-2381_t